LRRTFGPKREEDVSWRKLHNDELHSLYFSQHNIKMIKSRKMMWAGLVARVGEVSGVYRVLVGKPECKTPVVNLGASGRITLSWIFWRY